MANEAKKERILVLNLGSTSSKIAVYDDTEEVFKETIRHTQEEMAQFSDILDQFSFRNEKVRNALESNGIGVNTLTAVCSRGGNIIACPHGAIGIDQEMIDYLSPLIQGEVKLPYRNGLPEFLPIDHLTDEKGDGSVFHLL